MLNTRETCEAGLIQAHAVLVEATAAVESAQSKSAQCARGLANAKNAILRSVADPKELGSNEAVRAAKLEEMTAADAEACQIAEDALRDARHKLTVASLDWDLQKQIVKLLAVGS